ncbi:MAG: hypothetical protein INR66_04325 [Gordonia polyisoprenivorans]|nr:hypothetical protein [Gordonia polyisoprenivorans]
MVIPVPRHRAERDKPVDDWPDQFFGTVVYGLFPTCVLIEAPGSWQMLRIYPGATPGESVAYLTYGAPGGVQEGQEDYFPMAMDAAENVLVNQDFPMASSCQRGIAGGVESVVFGRNEPLLQHLARNWAEATQAVSHAMV